MINCSDMRVVRPTLVVLMLMVCGCSMAERPATQVSGRVSEIIPREVEGPTDEQIEAARMEDFLGEPFSRFAEDPELRCRWWDRIWKLWDGSPELYRPDFSDFDESRFFEAPPAPGAHPRMYLRPEQLPELRERLHASEAGKVFWRRYREECEKLHTDSPAGAAYRGLVENRQDEEFSELFAANAYEMAQLMMWESLRILVDDDHEAGARMARALTHYARHLQAVYDEKDIGNEHYFYPHIRSLPDYIKEKARGDKQYQEITAMFQEYSIVPAYDFIYPYMNDEQRAVVRSLIADLTENLWIHGMGIPYTGGNWGPHHWKGGEAAIAIEGEEGYDPDTVEGLRQVMTSFYSVDFTRAGALWEGLGKGVFGTHGLITAALRGWDIAATQPLRRTVSRTMLHAMLPGFRQMIVLGGLGTSSGDIRSKATDLVILKYFYPDDPVINYLYRLAVGEDYAWFRTVGFNRHFALIRNPLYLLLTVTDYKEEPLEAARTAALEAEGNTFFCPEFSILSTREDWSDEANWLYFFARSYNHAHTRNDRGHFTFAGLGRLWSVYNFGRNSSLQYASSYDAHNCSVPTVDGIGTLGLSVKTIAMVDTPEISLATSDLKHAWDWREHRPNNPSQRINPLNMAALQPLMDNPPAWHYAPYSLYPNWRAPGRPEIQDFRVPHAPVRHAYRSAGLVRGRHSYALILDDLKRDNEERLYAWNMALPLDVDLESAEGGRIILRETGVTNGAPRKCLVEVIQAVEGVPGLPAAALVRVEDYDGAVSSTRKERRLVVHVSAKAVRFKVMLYPFREGTDLPGVVMKDNQAHITWSDQRDRIDFAVDAEGLTIPSLRRDGRAIASPVPVHVPLPGAPPGHEFERGYAEPWKEISYE
jgi:hypothetical protein